MNTKEKLDITWVKGLATIHFLEIEETNYAQDGIDAVPNAYIRAQVKAEEFGGVEVHCHSYGGGIGFSSPARAQACVDHFATA